MGWEHGCKPVTIRCEPAPRWGDSHEVVMQPTLLLTQSCNLACDYCYVGKSPARMLLDRPG
jgi:MoaA/NifB/PqqE/SkfB family radical SAM enzyme